MIVTISKDIGENSFRKIVKWIENHNVKIKTVESDLHTVMVLTGDTALIDENILAGFDGVVNAFHLSESYTATSRKYRKGDTVIEVAPFGERVTVGRGLCFIAGPCSVESEEQIVDVAKKVKKAGASILRGGAFKPRTSPYSFQGLRETGITYLETARREVKIPVVSEIMDIRHIDFFENIDILQVGARNMQNYELLKELGRTDKPVLLKRAPSASIDELLMSAEYIMCNGNEKVILCERGICSFEKETRNTLDLAAVALLKKRTHLPVIVDPSHATGIAGIVEPMSLAAVATGADGVMTEVHSRPEDALCDGKQSITPDQLKDIVSKASNVKKTIGR